MSAIYYPPIGVKDSRIRGVEPGKDARTRLTGVTWCLCVLVVKIPLLPSQQDFAYFFGNPDAGALLAFFGLSADVGRADDVGQ